MRITDGDGKVLAIKENLQLEKGIQKFNYTSMLSQDKGFYYVQLLKDKRLVHFQEL